MKPLFFCIIFLCCATIGRAQDCLGYTFKPGTNLEMSTFSAKDKLTSKIAYQIKDVRKEGGSTVVDITVQIQDEKGKQQAPYNVRYTCTGDELIADMSGMMASMSNTMGKDMEMRMKTNELAYPGKLSVGQTLRDGKMEAEMYNNGSRMVEMTMTMNNRKVESTESLTTPAGTFPTYKISSDMNMENRVMGMPIRTTMRVVSYRADNQLLDVKSETYNKSGKLMGYTLLTRVN